MPSVSGRNYEIHSSPTQGRFLIASSTLPTGTLILTCEAFATAILDSHRKRLCAHCLSPSPTRTHTLRCSSCDQVYFCSLDCLSLSTRPQSSTTSTHASICSLLRKLATSKCSSHEKSIVKLIIMVYYQRRVLDEGTSDQFVKTGNEDDETKSSSGLGLTWTESLALQSHYTSWPSQSVKDWSQVTKWLNTHCQSLCEFPTPVETLMEWVSRIESNGFGIWALNKSESCMGRGLFPLASFFNHSCDPNCLVTQTQRVLEISTLREVEKGEELCISYINTNLPVQTRQRMLLEDYYFECKCHRCIEELKSPSKTKVSYPQSSCKKPSGKNKAKRAAAKKDKNVVNTVVPPIQTEQSLDPIPCDNINPTD